MSRRERPDPSARWGRDVPREHAPPPVRVDPIKHTVMVPPDLQRFLRAYLARAADERGWASASVQDVTVTLLRLLAQDETLQARTIAAMTGRRKPGGP